MHSTYSNNEKNLVKKRFVKTQALKRKTLQLCLMFEAHHHHHSQEEGVFWGFGACGNHHHYKLYNCRDT